MYGVYKQYQMLSWCYATTQGPQLFQLITSHCDQSYHEGGDPPECIPLSYQASTIGSAIVIVINDTKR